MDRGRLSYVGIVSKEPHDLCFRHGEQRKRRGRLGRQDARRVLYKKIQNFEGLAQHRAALLSVLPDELMALAADSAMIFAA